MKTVCQSRLWSGITGAVALALLAGGNPAWSADTEKKEVGEGIRFGQVKVGQDTGWVLFNEYEKDLQVSVAIPVDVRANAPARAPIEGKRFSVWLLLKDGKTALALKRPEGKLVEVGSGDLSANAIFVFAKGEGRKDVVGVTVMVDDFLTVFRMPKP